MIRFRDGLLTAGLLLVLVSAAEADIFFTANLTGAQEVPAVITPAKGFGFVTLNAAEDEIGNGRRQATPHQCENDEREEAEREGGGPDGKPGGSNPRSTPRSA